MFVLFHLSLQSKVPSDRSFFMICLKALSDMLLHILFLFHFPLYSRRILYALRKGIPLIKSKSLFEFRLLQRQMRRIF